MEATPSTPARAVPSTNRYVCVHGHFYQPPRENPWLETVEVQESAAPFHDWNERITAECYAPNGAGRIKNRREQIVRIVNNYARMSFNFGPTLLSWLELNAARTYRMILDADRESMRRFNGHGSAVAQVYNHMIMPLASERDARTQIRWGIADFESRFGRRPEGMWLAETAVSRSVLDMMAAEGIRYTILAPSQCGRTRPLPAAEAAALAATAEVPAATPASQPVLKRRASDRAAAAGVSDVPAAQAKAPTSPSPDAEPAQPWRETPGASVDPTQPYLVKLDGGRSMAVFFYDGPGSRAIAFEGLLNSGETFAQRLVSSLPSAPARPSLAHVATDGESYGHHHKHGEMALSFALQHMEDAGLATLTNYGEFLARFPPTHEAEVNDNTSWSCSHGVERWRADCGCNGGKAGWNQAWRGPLRAALDTLRDSVAPLAEACAAPLLHDLWAARDAYIGVILDRSAASVERFFNAHSRRELTAAERTTVLELMELGRHAQLMYTSCGWFFDEISGIETVQIMAYAGRVLQLAARLFGAAGEALEPAFLAQLAQARSNVPELGDGAEVYRRHVLPARVDLDKVGAHYAISSVFRPYGDASQIFCFDVHRQEYEVFTSGRGRVALGRATLCSQVTEEAEEIAFAVLHLGDQNLSAAVRRFLPGETGAWEQFSADARQAIRRADLPELIRLMDRSFGQQLYSLRSLFADEQRRILGSILDQTLSEVESSLERIYQEHATLLHFLSDANMPAPPVLAVAASLAINARLRKALEAEIYDSAEVAQLLRHSQLEGVKLDTELLRFTADQRMKYAMLRLESEAGERDAQAVLTETLGIAQSLATLPVAAHLWQAQNLWHDLLRRPAHASSSREWLEEFRALGRVLHIDVASMEADALRHADRRDGSSRGGGSRGGNPRLVIEPATAAPHLTYA